jgi:hypothetical protein
VLAPSDYLKPRWKIPLDELRLMFQDFDEQITQRNCSRGGGSYKPITGATSRSYTGDKVNVVLRNFAMKSEFPVIYGRVIQYQPFVDGRHLLEMPTRYEHDRKKQLATAFKIPRLKGIGRKERKEFPRHVPEGLFEPDLRRVKYRFNDMKIELSNDWVEFELEAQPEFLVALHELRHQMNELAPDIRYLKDQLI